MHEDIILALKEYKNFNDFYLRYYRLLSVLRDRVKDKEYTLSQTLDLIYVLRETSKQLDDLRKEANGVEAIMINIACLLYLTKGGRTPIRGKLAVGSPNVKMNARIPHMKRNPEEFAALMKYFKIPIGPVEEGILKPYWPSMMEHFSKCAEEGRPLPPGVDPSSQYPEYKMRVSHKKDLLEALDDATKGGDK